MRRIYIGADSAGFRLKEEVKEHLNALGYEVCDLGCDSEASCHYPIFADAACKKILSGECEQGILICGTGIGMSIAANKHKGIRAACCSDVFSARLTKEHNDANMLCFGERVVGIGTAIDLVDAFLDAKYLNNGNHVTRVAMLKDIEDGNL